MQNIIFDLDGTISNSAEGVRQSLNFALTEMGAEPVAETDINRYIGPPLQETFAQLLKTDAQEVIDEAVAKFRQDHTNSGHKLSRMYTGIEKALNELKREGHKLFLATTKSQALAESVIEHFGIGHLFDGIYAGGGTMDKTELLRKILDEHSLNANACIMVGDRDFDIKGAKETGMRSVGVLWGYGTRGEIADADFLAATPDVILKNIKEYRK
ncbi:HAD hydrolase-like protein [Limisalsivibrio acetivorans]|uniref:HAD hydrolase-like protein n=1 Tax=Limisalsivibrio acetivorans TaxID=1304888 RepID=UPI0003B4DF1F|nr:HAD hydrolase-like protein [Limisalsivibrio acetivorans]